jgi:copper chaperone CopZ
MSEKISESSRDCCNNSKEKSSLKQGLLYGLVPHIGCIGFVAASILGVTVAVEFFKPLLMNPWFFYILIGISLMFATVSTAIYLKQNNILSMKGVLRKKKYISAMFGSTIGINLLFFLLIFPMAANFGTIVSASPSGLAILPENNSISTITLQVEIPCSGHAPLISGELKKIQGVQAVKFNFPNNFDVAFDSSKTTKEQMFALDVFKQYPAKVISESKAGGNANLAPLLQQVPHK